MKQRAKGIIVLAVMAVFGFSTLAFAGWGNGCNYGMGRGNQGANWNHGDGSGHGHNYGNLSEEEIATVEQKRAEFFKATENTRQKLYEKEVELRSELSKESPDTSKASKLQSDISKLQSELDQTRLDYQIQARKSVPNYGRGNQGQGHMMGRGTHGDRYCRW